jgi:hypothetical protein
MIVESAVFIKGYNEHCIRPISRIAKALINAFHQVFPFSDIVQGMHGIAIQIVIPGIVTRLDKIVIGQTTLFDILKKVFHVLELLRERIDVLIAQAGDSGSLRQAVVINAPIFARVFQPFINRLILKGKAGENLTR